MYIILLIAQLLMPAFALVADSTSQDLYEKTWPRANSFCTLKDKRIEILIRGGNKFTEIKEKGYGEYVFWKIDEKIELFAFSRTQASLYRFYKSSDGSICAKSQGFFIEGNKFAFLFAEESRPHGDKLIIQLFDFKTMKPLETIDTNLLVEKAYPRPGGFIFKAMEERYEMDMGYVQIEKEKYTYQDRVFPKWMKFSSKGMEIDPGDTFKKLPWRKYFKTEADFTKAAGWDSAKKLFVNKTVYYAVKRPAIKRCISFLPAKKKLDGSETWYCH